jgi:hypothetical protein
MGTPQLLWEKRHTTGNVFMFNLQQLAGEYGLTDQEIGAILKIPKSLVENGLENYQFNETMRKHLREQIERIANLQSTPVPSPGLGLPKQASNDWMGHRHIPEEVKN